MGISTYEVSSIPKDIDKYEVVSASTTELFDYSEWDKSAICSVEKVEGEDRYFVSFYGNHFAEIEKKGD